MISSVRVAIGLFSRLLSLGSLNVLTKLGASHVDAVRCDTG